MKKFVLILSIFLFLSFGINSIITSAQPLPSKTLSQGVYIVKDSLAVNVPYTIQNTSSNESIVIVLDSNKSLREYIRLDPKEFHYNLKPLSFGDTIIIVSNANINFS